MRRSVLIAVIGAAAAGVVIITIVSLAFYSYRQLEFSVSEISISSIELNTGSIGNLVTQGLNALSGDIVGSLVSLIQSMKVNLTFAITNHGVLPVYVPDFSFDLLINGIKIGEGKGSANLWINPGENKTITVAQDLQRSGLQPATQSVINNQGVMNISAVGTADARVLGASFQLPFNVSKQVSLKDEASKYLGAK